MLHDSVATIATMPTRPRAMLLAMTTMGKSTHGFPFLSYMSMGLCLAALRAAGAPLLIFIIAATYIYMYEYCAHVYALCSGGVVPTTCSSFPYDYNNLHL